MDLREKIYQMFVLSPTSTELSGDINIINALKNGLGGVIFFTKNIASIDQTKKLISDIKDVAKVSPFFGIDEEGGRVERTERIFNGKNFLSAQIQAQKGIKYVEKETEKISDLLNNLGFNMNFAPVLDVNTNPNNPIIGERAYSHEPNAVFEFASCAIKTYMKNGIIPVCKHFPGHGDAGADSHLTLPTINCDLGQLENTHILPFKYAIEYLNIPAIMVAHLYCPCFDNDKIPTSLSKKVLDYLRNNLKFDGVIVSDDMQMGALQNINPVEAVIMGIKAGVNLFLFRDCENNTVEIIERVLSYAEKDKLLQNKIADANKKIIALKKSFRLL